MFVGLFQPIHLLMLTILLVVFGIPFFLICRLLWRKGSSKQH
jgi:hypothetical protein